MCPKSVVNRMDLRFPNKLVQNHQANNSHSYDNVIRILRIEDCPARGYQAILVTTQHNLILIPRPVDRRPEKIQMKLDKSESYFNLTIFGINLIDNMNDYLLKQILDD